jgi:branched-chain amino acid transport system substrate-binding protein
LRQRVAAFLPSLLVALAAGCGPETPAGPAAGPGASAGAAPAAGGATVKIGVAGPITGGQAKNGQDLKEGTMLAVEDWNAKGGVLGRKIELLVKDDEASDKNATTVAQALVDAGVVGVVGHFNSGCTIPASEKYHGAGIVTITPASTNVFVTDRKYADVFRVAGRDDQQGTAAAKFVRDVLKAKKVAVFDNRTAYGKGLADEFVKGLDGKVEVLVREGFDETERNFRPFLTKLKEAAPDLWYFGGIYEQAAPMLIQASQLGITTPMMSGDGVHGYDLDFIAKVGAPADGTFTTFPDTTKAPGYEDFVKRYRERFNAEPGPYAIYSYASASILFEGIVKAGSTEGPKVAAAIHAGSFDTPVGKIEFDEKGDVKALDYYSVWVIRDRKHVLYGSK